MENYIEPLMPEELMAAYLDGTLSDEDAKNFEDFIFANPEMEEILYDLDLADANYIQDPSPEIPVECLADDFVLPSLNHGAPIGNYAFPDDFQEMDLAFGDSGSSDDSPEWSHNDIMDDSFDDNDDDLANDNSDNDYADDDFGEFLI